MSNVKTIGQIFYGGAEVSGDVLTPVVVPFGAVNMGIQLVGVGGSSVSTTLQASVDGVHFKDVTDSTQTLSAGVDSQIWEVSPICSPQYRLKITATDGAGTAASGSIETGGGGTLSFEADDVGLAGNNISVELVASVAAEGSIAGSVGSLAFTAVDVGVTGNSIEVVLVGGGTAGAETIDVTGTVITVDIEVGVSDADDIKTLIDGTPVAAALISVVSGSGAMEADSVTLSGGLGDVAGSEVVSVDGNAITVLIEDGVSTSSQIKTALDADVDAAALIDTTATVDDAMSAGSVTLSGGVETTSDLTAFVYTR